MKNIRKLKQQKEISIIIQIDNKKFILTGIPEELEEK